MSPREWFSEVEGSEPLLSVGKIMPYSAIEIRDENNQPLPPGEIGEIALQCEGQITEIMNEPELTRQRLVDGWVLSGDIGKIDENGYVYLTDRKDDMIISGGFNIWPTELENVISNLKGVREVAVVAAPHERWGEVPVAVVVLNDGAQVSEDDIVEACKVQLGSYKRPGSVVLREAFARTPVGKISGSLLGTSSGMILLVARSAEPEVPSRVRSLGGRVRLILGFGTRAARKGVMRTNLSVPRESYRCHQKLRAYQILWQFVTDFDTTLFVKRDACWVETNLLSRKEAGTLPAIL